MNTRSAARLWHAATAAIAAFGLLAQLVLVSIGAFAPPGEVPPPLPVRLWRFFSYFTISVTVLIFAVSNLYWLGDRRLPSSRVLVTDAA